MKNKKGFTLVELLAVLVILGIILGIVIPSVTSMFQNQKVKRYEYHENAVKEATEAYVDQYKESFEEEQGICSCYKIMYEDLLKEDLLKEDDITCDLNQDNDASGYILAYPIGNSNINFKYEYYLTCKDKSSNEIIHTANETENTCCGVNGDFRIQNYIVKYNNENGADYKGEWTKESVYQRFETISPYMVPITKYEYSLDGGRTWTAMTDNNMTFTNHMDATVQVRAIDADGNKSSIISYKVRIDKTAPTAEFGIQGTLGENEWYTTSLVIKPKNESDIGSGIASATVNIGSITTPTGGTTLILTVVDKVGNTSTYQKIVKVDNVKPQITFGINGVNTGTASCSVSISGLRQGPTPSMYLSNGANRTFTVSCTNNAGVTTTQSHTYTYSSCRTGENTCSYGCDKNYNPCKSTHWDSCISQSSYCKSCTCTKNSTSCWDYDAKPSCPNGNITVSGGKRKCCVTKPTSYSCTSCSTCGTGYSCNGGNVCDPGYDYVNCSSCYYGHNTCAPGFWF